MRVSMQCVVHFLSVKNVNLDTVVACKASTITDNFLHDYILFGKKRRNDI